MQITLLRHGKPEFELTGNVKACDLSQIAKSYDLSGITGTPPKEAIALTQNHNLVVCSDLPRSLQSAEALGIPEVHLTDALFSETGIPHFSKGSVTLPLSAWVILLRAMWLFGFSKNGESFSAAKERARNASQKLIQLAEQYEKVLLVGHGFINHFIAKELLANNWTGPSRPGSKYWEYSIYKYNAI